VLGAAIPVVLISQEQPEPVRVERPVEPLPVPQVPVAPVPPTPEPADPPEILDVGLGDYPPRGPAEAPVQIVAFTDLQCPFCGRAADTLDELLQTREGLVSVWIRDFPLAMHQQARGAHIALRCADDQDATWAMHDRLFDHRDALHHDDLVEHARWLGLDVPEFRRCLDDDAERHGASIDRDIAEGSAHGVRGTPTFFVNGVLLSGAQPLQRFEAAVDAAVERVQPR
jgi:protein-disulfide isomerase